MKKKQTDKKRGNIPSRLVLWAMAVATALFRVPDKIRRTHLADNTRIWKELAPEAVKNGYIERQQYLESLQYGISHASLSRHLLAGRPLTGRENTCEIIAVYNAMRALNMLNTDLPDLLYRFERRGISLGGYFGTSLYAVRRFFKKQECHTAVLYGARVDLPNTRRLAQMGEVFILTMRNSRENLFDMIHTVCITKAREGVVVHNGSEPGCVYNDIYDAVSKYNSGRGRAVWLMALQRPACSLAEDGK